VYIHSFIQLMIAGCASFVWQLGQIVCEYFSLQPNSVVWYRHKPYDVLDPYPEPQD